MARRPRRPPAPRRIVPPTGYYDPALDAQRRSATRGLGYLRQDTELAGARAAQDYGFGVEDLTRGRDRGLEDLTLGRDRGLFDLTSSRDRGFADLDTSLSRGTEDYNRDVAMLGRSYQQLGRRQGEGARAAGVLSGGLALKAAQVRAANQAIDRQPIDTGFQRLGENVATQRTRLGQDFDTGVGRIKEDFGIGSSRLGQDFLTGRGRLDVDFNRGTTDRATALSRGELENRQFGLDIDAQRLYEATQAGWVPPPVPRAPRAPAREIPGRRSATVRRVGPIPDPFRKARGRRGNVPRRLF